MFVLGTHIFLLSGSIVIMSKKEEKKISIVHLLSLLPDKELDRIGKRTRINRYVKVLDGKSLFYLILYSLVERQRNSLRTMEDIFNSSAFKFLFNLPENKTVKYNSISERLSVINIEFFKQIYELVYKIFSEHYNKQEIEGHKLVRVDSTMVAEASNKLKQGMNIGKKKDGKKQVKYTIAFDGSFPGMSELFTNKMYLSEDKTIPEVVFKYAKKDKNSIFAFDRGVQQREVFTKLSEENTLFVCRIKKNARIKITDELEKGDNRSVGALELISDQKILLAVPGAKTFHQEPFRLITAINPNTKTTYRFLTNIFDRNVEQILVFYKKRWDIEVFFRFLKQELNFSHLFSTNENGIMVMLYMTLITSMLVLVYKRTNNVGYKTAVRRISFELNEFVIRLVVQHLGGDPKQAFHRNHQLDYAFKKEPGPFP